MITNTQTEILRFLCCREVPLVHGVRLLCSVADIHLQEVAEHAGVGRNHLYQMLAGTRPVSDSARRAMQVDIGLDPWQVQAEAKQQHIGDVA